LSDNVAHLSRKSKRIAKYISDRIAGYHNVFSSIFYPFIIILITDIILELISYDIGGMWRLLVILGISILFISVLYYIIEGYCSNATLVLKVKKDDVIRGERDWKEVLKGILDSTVEVSKEYGFYVKDGCKVKYSLHNDKRKEFLECSYAYKGAIPLTVKFFLFKLETDHIILTITVRTHPYNVLWFLLKGWVEGISKKAKGEVVIEVDPWYELTEDFDFLLDDVIKALKKESFKLEETVP